jgi:Dolichyl-phosphate-mannose-protein mannosyltransferase
LVFFAFASAAAYFLALREGRLAYYAVAGVALGLAFLSKYFSVLLGVAYLAHFLYAPKIRNRVTGFLLLIACAIAFAAINLHWNYTHCWDNLMFNLFNRNKGEAFSAVKPLLYGAMLVYLVTPPALYYAYRRRGQWLARLRATGLTPYAFVLAVPLAFFLLLSMLKVVGLHWLLAFYPFLFFLLAAILETHELRRCVGFMAWFSLAHFALIIVFALVPLEAWKGTRQYDGLVFLFSMPEILAGLQRYTADFHFATEGYTASSILTYHYRGTRVVSVFGAGTHHARQDDILTDYRGLDGKNIAVLLNHSPDANAFAPYFRSIDNKAFDLHGYPFHVVFGQGFNYRAYREDVLRNVKNAFYRIPGFLPIGACGFCARYFPDEPCR